MFMFLSYLQKVIEQAENLYGREDLAHIVTGFPAGRERVQRSHTFVGETMNKYCFMTGWLLVPDVMNTGRECVRPRRSPLEYQYKNIAELRCRSQRPIKRKHSNMALREVCLKFTFNSNSALGAGCHQMECRL